MLSIEQSQLFLFLLLRAKKQSSCLEFWEQEILAKHTEKERSKLLGWVRGVSVHEFIDVNASGTFLERSTTERKLLQPNLTST